MPSHELRQPPTSKLDILSQEPSKSEEEPQSPAAILNESIRKINELGRESELSKTQREEDQLKVAKQGMEDFMAAVQEGETFIVGLEISRGPGPKNVPNESTIHFPIIKILDILNVKGKWKLSAIVLYDQEEIEELFPIGMIEISKRNPQTY